MNYFQNGQNEQKWAKKNRIMRYGHSLITAMIFLHLVKSLLTLKFGAYSESSKEARNESSGDSSVTMSSS